jgi:hypothetical protein
MQALGVDSEIEKYGRKMEILGRRWNGVILL